MGAGRLFCGGGAPLVFLVGRDRLAGCAVRGRVVVFVLVPVGRGRLPLVGRMGFLASTPTTNNSTFSGDDGCVLL